MNLEAAVMVRIDDMDGLRVLGSWAIRIPLTEVGPETVPELVAEALREAPNPIHSPERWSKT